MTNGIGGCAARGRATGGAVVTFVARATAALCIVLVAALVAAAGLAFGATASKTLPNGDQVQFNGTYYDFRDAAGRLKIQMWVPPSAQPVRGVLLGGRVRDENQQALAARFGFGVAELGNFSGGQVFPRPGQSPFGRPQGAGAPAQPAAQPAQPAQPPTPQGKVFFDALSAFASLGIHPELANIPFVAMGSSNGGMITYGLASYAPERTLCFVSNVAAPRSILNEATMAVPGIFLVGRYDLLSREEAAVRTGYATVLAARAKGARWAYIVEEMGHEDGVAYDVYAKLIEECVKLRYPASMDPRQGPVKLLDIPEENGWLADMKTDGDDVVQIGDFKSYPGEKDKAAWLPDKDMAYIFRAAATRNGPLVLGVDEVGRPYNPYTDPRAMSFVGGPVVNPGRKLKLVCDVRDMPDWSKIEFYNGATKVGEAKAGSKPVCVVKVGTKDAVWCVSALGYSKSGKMGTSMPFYFTVRDPKLEMKSAAEKAPKPVFKDAVGIVGSKTALSVPADYQPKAGAVAQNVLMAYGLTAEEEKTFGATPGKVSAFWSAIDADHDQITMIPSTNFREGGAPFSIVTSMDARLRVKSAHSARGLYLYFEVNDNHFMNAPDDPTAYGRTDVLDVLLDHHSSQWINDPANVSQAFEQGYGLFLTTTQYMVAFGNDVLPKLMKRIAPDPWNVVYDQMTPLADLQKHRGIQVRFAKINRLTRAQEWFIPWSELGRTGADSAEPAVGTRFAFAPGYNDTDPGDQASKELRWIGKPADPNALAPTPAPAPAGPGMRGPAGPKPKGKTSPWAEPANGGVPPRGWGDIEIGPMIGQAAPTAN